MFNFQTSKGQGKMEEILIEPIENKKHACEKEQKSKLNHYAVLLKV